ncbi:MAG: SDR family oxidoreductase [Dehalococcoidia bacterium]
MDLSKFALTDRVAIVAGAAGNLGSAIALAFADAGAHLVLVDLTAEKAEVVAAQIRAKGREALILPTDCTDSGQVNNMVERAVKEFGRIDIFANATGRGREEPPLLEISEREFDEIFTHNLKPFLLCSQAVARVMVKQKKGAIVNLTTGWLVRMPWHIQLLTIAYKVASVGTLYLTQAMAAQWGPYGIRVNAVAPRLLESARSDQDFDYRKGAERLELQKIIPLGHFGAPENAAWAAVYLASDAARFVNGATINVDGGPNL